MHSQLTSTEQITEIPRSRFRVLPAFSTVLREEVFRLRHLVFCEELDLFEASADRRETDVYDERAILLLLRHTPTDESIGCVRLVMTSRADQSSCFPFENICGDAIYRALFDPRKVPRDSIGEASRLGVVRRFRRRKGEATGPLPLEASGAKEGLARDARQFPYILVSLYLGTIAMAVRKGIDYLVSVTEPRLVTHLATLGVPITVFGPPVQYKGLRVPGVIGVPETVERFNPFVRSLYLEIARDIEQQEELQNKIMVG